MAKKIEDAIREADIAMDSAWRRYMEAYVNSPEEQQAGDDYDAECERWMSLRAAQARGVTTVEDGE